MNDHMRHLDRADGSPGYIYTLPGVGVAQTLGYVTAFGPHDDEAGCYPRAAYFRMGEPMAARPVYGGRGVQHVDQYRWTPGELAALRLRSARRLAAGPSWAAAV